MNSAAAWMPCQYKDYVLFMLFIQYVSDEFSSPAVIPQGASFKDMFALKAMMQELPTGRTRLI